MGRIKSKGKAGAAKAYITRSAATKKLQCSLADFRRLCILKGIYPREPRHRKKANKGNSAPTSFYYQKDIAYLAHEPVLRKLREHKAFAKKLSRAIGRGEWSSAKSLEDNKPVYKLDHIIKERYPSFIDAVRDIDDALCMIFLFASLPSDGRVSPALVENCARLAAEWQLYIMHTHSLRKCFLSIKGVYYQAEVSDQTVTWLVPYSFTQYIPTDVDVRVMLTFLELYQTLLGFVFFKLYTDLGLVYPPPLDIKKAETAAGVGAYSLQDAARKLASNALASTTKKSSAARVEVNGKTVSGKDVRKVIRSLDASSAPVPSENDDAEDTDEETMAVDAPAATSEVDEEFVIHSSTKNTDGDPSTADATTTALPTLQTISALPRPLSTTLFAPYTFWLSRETSRSIFEFLVRSFGGHIGWPASSGSGSPIADESDDAITHVIIDRPLPANANRKESEEERKRRLSRKYVQPQWIVDCINAGKILLEEPYLQGKELPPHLSPFGDLEGAYDPLVADNAEAGAAKTVDREGDAEMVDGEDEGSESESEEEDEIEGEDEPDVEDDEDEEEDEEEPTPAPTKKSSNSKKRKALKAIADVSSEDPAALRAAELAAEAAGMDYGTFEKEMRKSRKKNKNAEGATATTITEEVDMNKMMMSNKQKKLYEKIKYSQAKKAAEREKLTKRKQQLDKEKKRQAKTSS